MRLVKITRIQDKPKRRYDDACGAAFGLELLGDRWTMLVVRELMYGPKRFGELRADLPGISANVLTQRLEELEASQVLVRRKLPPPASAQVYELTEWGREAEPVIQQLGKWAARSPQHNPTLPLSSTSMLMSLRTMLDHRGAAGWDIRIGFRFGAESFMGHLVNKDLAIVRGEIGLPDLTFITDPCTLAAVVYSGEPLEQFEADGALRIEGDRAIALRFLALFSLPSKFSMA